MVSSQLAIAIQLAWLAQLAKLPKLARQLKTQREGQLPQTASQLGYYVARHLASVCSSLELQEKSSENKHSKKIVPNKMSMYVGMAVVWLTVPTFYISSNFGSNEGFNQIIAIPTFLFGRMLVYKRNLDYSYRQTESSNLIGQLEGS